MCHVNLDMKQADIERRYDVAHEHGRLLPLRPGRPGLGSASAGSTALRDRWAVAEPALVRH